MVRVKLQNVSKVFEMEHEGVSSLKEKFVTTLRRKRRKGEKIWALRNVSFEARGGECVGVIGENASGKTTLLKIIGGMLEPTSGRVIVEGKVATLLTLGIGFNPELTARENVYLYGSIMGFTKNEIDSKYEDIVEFSELSEFMDVKLKSFSDGMKVRLGFATAISVDADILLIDEVLAVGDGAFQAKCLKKFEELKRRGKIIIFVSHGLETIRKYSDKVIFLHEGKVKGIGNPGKIVESYEMHLKNKELKGYNEESLRRMKDHGIVDVKFYRNGEESWVFRTGDRFEAWLKFKLKKKPSSFFLSFVNEKRVKFYSKRMGNNKVEFSVNSFPLEKGKYRVFVGGEEVMGYRNLEVMVWEGKASNDGRVFSEDLSLDGKVYAFGKNCGRILEDFEKGRTLVVFSDIEDASKDFGEGAIFKEGKVVFRGKKEEVVEKYKDRLYERIVKEYGKELGLDGRKDR